MIEYLKSLWDKKGIRLAVIVLLSLLALASLIQGSRNAIEFSQDFQWDAAKAFALKINPYELSLNGREGIDAPELTEFYELFEAAGAPQKMEANQFPSLLMLLLPFTLAAPYPARLMWLTFNIILTGLMILMLRKTFLKVMDAYAFAALALLMLAGTPYRNQLGVGQHTIFAFTAFLVAVYFSEKEKGFIPTTLALIVCYFKYTLTVPLLLYFVYRKKYKEIIASVLVHVGLTFVSAIWLGESFINMIIEPLKVSSALICEGGFDLSALFGAPVGLALALIVMVVLLLLTIKLPEGCDEVLIAVLTLWSLVVTYHRIYDFFVIILASALFIGCRAQSHPEDSKLNTAIFALYVCSMLGLFFVLRIFSDAAPAMITVAAIYYALCILSTWYLIIEIKRIDKWNLKRKIN